MDLNFNYKEVLLEARGNKIPKLLVILEILRRLTHDSLEIEMKYSYIEDDSIKNKNGIFFIVEIKIHQDWKNKFFRW